MWKVTDEMIECWRINFGLDTRTPEDAMKLWADQFGGLAPAGAVAALGLVLKDRERLIEEIDELRSELRLVQELRNAD